MSATDTVAIYLKEIARYPMLEASEEITLGKQVQRMMHCLETKENLEKQKKKVISQKDWAKAVDLSQKQLTQVLRLGNLPLA